ncbi:MAG: Glutaminase, partial [Pedosphaera sp.]|nr:Glutaminase [Pedosphaera sp.]
MKSCLLPCLAVALAALSLGQLHAQPFRPPSVPLITFDPYLSVWSPSDHLTGHTTEHWTHREHSLVSLIRVDGQVFRLMGTNPKDAPALPQVGLEITPTRSIYDFENASIHVTLTFMTPALPNDLDAMALPLSFLTWQVRSTDGKEHSVALYDSTSSQLVVNRNQEKVQWGREKAGDLTALRLGTAEQKILGSSGDDHRINWGYAYAAASSAQAKSAVGADQALVNAFMTTGQLPASDDARMPRAVNDAEPVMAFVFDLGRVADKPVTRQVIVAYDEIFAIKYFGHKLLPFWKRNGATASEMLRHAAKEYPSLAKRCADFDARLVADATKLGGAKYARMCALAYRQCAAACGLAADANKQPLFFTKENTSNGDIATVDVIFPMDPQWLLLSPALAKATLVPILSYAASWHWKFPNAPHDLGTYPIASGTDDGGEGMPVEESGNMLILCDAIAQADGNAKFVSPWWPQLTQWAKYLENYGLDPENQLCTDDFMGHLAHNANLSVKAILGLACYGDLCHLRGDEANAAKYHQLAKTDAEHWMKVAAEGDHYRLAFDKPNTWSQKYNLVWDRILGLNIFPPEVAQKEIAQYKKAMQRFGVPLDSRTKLTKTDWSIWSATLADNQDDFEALTSPIYAYLGETTARSPFVDSFMTDDSHSDGMHARPVIGGVFIKMLTDRPTWKKWASAGKVKVGDWAPLPESPKITEVVPTSQQTALIWRYTTQKPAGDWAKADYDATAWKEGPGSFGTSGTPGAVPRTRWDTGDIWLRREVQLPAAKYSNLQFFVDHDEDVEVYVNGVLASTDQGFTTSYVPLEISPDALALLKPDAKV